MKLEKEQGRHQLWFAEFQTSLVGMREIVTRIETALEREIAQREAGQSLLQRLLDSHEKNLARLNVLTQRHRLVINLFLWIAGAAVLTIVSVYFAGVVG